jgi:hypothetical protein
VSSVPMRQISVDGPSKAVESRLLEGKVTSPLWSDMCGWEDLATTCSQQDLSVGRAMLDLDHGWSGRWTATWKVGKAKRTGPVADLDSVPLNGCVPWRGFTWRQRQHHRPGLEPMLTTGRQQGMYKSLHGFENMNAMVLEVIIDALNRASASLPGGAAAALAFAVEEKRQGIDWNTAMSFDLE